MTVEELYEWAANNKALNLPLKVWCREIHDWEYRFLDSAYENFNPTPLNLDDKKVLLMSWWKNKDTEEVPIKFTVKNLYKYAKNKKLEKLDIAVQIADECMWFNIFTSKINPKKGYDDMMNFAVML